MKKNSTKRFIFLFLLTLFIVGIPSCVFAYTSYDERDTNYDHKYTYYIDEGSIYIYTQNNKIIVDQKKSLTEIDTYTLERKGSNNTIVVTMKDSENYTSNHITITNNSTYQDKYGEYKINVVLYNVKIKNCSSSAVSVNNIDQEGPSNQNCDVVLKLAGKNELHSAGEYCAALEKKGEGTLYIEAATNDGELVAEGGRAAAAIGASNNLSEPQIAKNIVINSGKITAKAGADGGSGIGSSWRGFFENITINGGTVSAYGSGGSDPGSAIGGNVQEDVTSTVTINGGEVTAFSYISASKIKISNDAKVAVAKDQNTNGFDTSKLSKNGYISKNGEKTYGTCENSTSSATTHNWVYSNSAKCLATGTERWTCSHCNEVSFEIGSASLGHSWEDTGTVTAATCVSKQITTYKCTRADCTETKKEETGEINSSNHLWDNGTVTKAATCVAKGTIKYKCERDGCSGAKTDEIAIDSSKHNWSTTGVTKTAATCLEAGTMEYKCTNTGCTVTQSKPIEALGHKFSSSPMEVIQEKTCTTDGIYKYACQNVGCTETKEETVAPEGHSYGNYISDNNATCQKDGTKTRYCKKCDAKETVKDGGSKKICSYSELCTDTVAHWWRCPGCGAINGRNNHQYDNDDDLICNNENCKYERLPVPTVTAPAAASNLTYNGSEQTLITAGTTTGGTLMYSLALEWGYEETLPVGKNAGTYTIYYKVFGNNECRNSKAYSIKVTIEARAITVKPKNQSITVNDTLPTSYDLECIGLATGDTAEAVITDFATLKGTVDATVDGKTVGEYVITAPATVTLASAYTGNYTLTTQNGTLTVNARRSSGGGTSGGGTSGGAVVAPSTDTGSDNVVNKAENKKTDTTASTTATITNTTTKTTTTTPATDGHKATTTTTITSTVDTTTADKIVEKAVENKSKEVVIDAQTSTSDTSSSKDNAAAEIIIPTTTITQLSEKTSAKVIIKTDSASIALDKKAVAAVTEQIKEASEASGDTAAGAAAADTLKLTVTTVEQTKSSVKLDVKIETANGEIKSFNGGKVTVTVNLNSQLASKKKLVCVYINDKKLYSRMPGKKNANGTFTFTTTHFSTYAIMTEEEVDQIIAEQTADAKELASKIKLSATSKKTSKGNIKVTLKVTKGTASLQKLEDLGYTVKYKFYRSTKKSSNYKAMTEKQGKTYTNTTGKKGTRYYYKARVLVYDSEGTLVASTALKSCKYATRVR